MAIVTLFNVGVAGGGCVAVDVVLIALLGMFGVMDSFIYVFGGR